MIAGRVPILVMSVVLGAFTPSIAHAQQRPRANNEHVVGYATFGRINFTAADSFEAILGDPGGTILGGGLRIDLRMGGLFFDVGAWRFQRTGERAFIFQDQVIPLGIPIKVTALPIEITGGWRFHMKHWRRLVPYVAGGLTSMRYREESDFSTAFENNDNTFNGLLARAGAEYQIIKWVAVGGEAAWSSLPDALGEGGVSKAFDETNLGGTSFRFKISVGR